MVSERSLRVFEPGVNASISFVQDAIGSTDFQPGDDLFDQLPFTVLRERGNYLLLIEHARGYERPVPSLAVRA
jgi:hypothetical protein